MHRLNSKVLATVFNVVFTAGVTDLPSALAQPAAFEPSPSSDSQSLNEKRAQDVSDFLTFRDPFLAPDLGDSSELSRLALERYPVSDFKVVAVMSGPIKKRAMLNGPDGKSYVVSEQMKLGVRNGVISRITTNSIIVREQIVNAIGQHEYLDVELSVEKSRAMSAVER